MIYSMGDSGRGLIFSLIILVSLILSSCNNVERSKFRAKNRVDFDTIMVNKRHYLENDTVGPYCDLKIDFIYPIRTDKNNLDELQQSFVKNFFGSAFESMDPVQAVEAYVNTFTENYNRDANTYQQNISEMNELNVLISGIDISNTHDRNDEMFYSYYESLSDSIVFNQYDVISFQVRQTSSKGGATSKYVSYSNFVVNLQTGNIISENEIFKAGYDKALQNLIVTSLLDQNMVNNIEELEDIGFFGISEIIPNNNFLLNEKGVIYTYNKGEYSALQLSAPEVFIPYTAIRSLIRENSVAGKLANL